MSSPEERAHVATKKFVRELFEALELDSDIEAGELEKEIDATTDIIVARIDERLSERFGDLFG